MSSKALPLPWLFTACAVAAAIIGALAVGLFGWAGGLAAVILAGAGAWAFAAFGLKPPAPEPQAVAAGPAPAPAAPPPAPIPADRIDTLTGLANENGLMAWFREKGARLAADNMGIIVLVAKLDGFAQIVARYGAAKGDLVVKEIAARVAVVAKTEGDGIAARTGGEEFGAVVAVVPNKSDAVAAERAGHLLELIGRPIEHADGAIWVGGCVGAAAGSPLAGPATLERARVALAKAARMGRGQCAIAPSE